MYTISYDPNNLLAPQQYPGVHFLEASTIMHIFKVTDYIVLPVPILYTLFQLDILNNRHFLDLQ